MQRQQLLASLASYQSQHGEEAAVVARFTKFIETHENCFSRTCVPGHITGSAWLLNPGHTHVLLTHHRKLNRWLQLGGHSDGDSDTLRVARREAEEESGLGVKPIERGIFDIDVHEIPVHGKEPAHLHFDVRYVLVSVTGEEFSISEESHDLAWVPLSELTEYTREESILRMHRKWRALRA